MILRSDKQFEPASNTRALTFGSSVIQVVITSLDVPPPTMMKSKYSEPKNSVEEGSTVAGDIMGKWYFSYSF
jgi:hypothetical protein